MFPFLSHFFLNVSIFEKNPCGDRLQGPINLKIGSYTNVNLLNNIQSFLRSLGKLFIFSIFALPKGANFLTFLPLLEEIFKTTPKNVCHTTS